MPTPEERRKARLAERRKTRQVVLKLQKRIDQANAAGISKMERFIQRLTKQLETDLGSDRAATLRVLEGTKVLLKSKRASIAEQQRAFERGVAIIELDIADLLHGGR